MKISKRNCLNVIFAILLAVSTGKWAIAGGDDHAHGTAPDAQAASSAGWEERFKAQLAREDEMEGRAGHADKVEAAMNKLMEEISKGSKGRDGHTGESGPFSGMAMMQQMDRSFFLGPTGASESVAAAGRCPKNASVREYDVSAVNVEVTLNQWLDYHPGYMYVLTENLEKVREEEKKNREARAKPGYDPGAVSNGLQTDLIQPLNIRGNQGDCIVLTLQNKLDGEDVSLHIHGSSAIVRASGKAATIANPESTVKPGEKQVFEWYIRPDEQEGGHAFHSHVGREQSSLGMIGTFIVEPIGSRYLDPITGKETKSGW
ncbi:MAG TPA: multicopper oxidase domain-containing protein, partial [Candidatus Manganitrophaceae bacterium]